MIELVKNGVVELDKVQPRPIPEPEKMPATALTIADEMGNVVTVAVDAKGKTHCVNTAVTPDSMANLLGTAARLLDGIVFLTTEEVME